MKLLIALTLLFTLPALAKTRVAIIDTGVPSIRVPLCGDNYDFSKTSIMDTHGHATSIAALVDKYAEGADYCQIHLKYFSKNNQNAIPAVTALIKAVALAPDVIVYAGGGPALEPELQKYEKKTIKIALDSGIKVVVAAGNNRHNLDVSCNYFPACYDSRIIVVGNKYKGKIVSSSNRGKIVDYYEEGTNRPEGGKLMSGTSQATAIRAGKIIKEMSK